MLYLCMTKESSTKRAILQKGFEMASSLSLGTISIGSLAKEMQMSKSGVFAHFQSKENLQLEILDFAARIFAEEVIIPSFKVDGGIPRIKEIVKRWIKWGLNIKGGCLFVDATTEFNNRPGNIQNRLMIQQKKWMSVLEKVGESAVKTGDIKSDTDCKQFAFDLYCLVLGYYYYSQLIKDPLLEQRQDISLNQFIKNYSN